MNHFGLKKLDPSFFSSCQTSLSFIFPWARHSVGTGAEPTCDGCGRNFSIVALDAGADDDEAAADGGKCVAAWAGGRRRGRYAVQRPPRCLSRTDHFPFGARHSAETSAELNVRLGAAEFLPVASRQVRRVRKRRREGNATAAQWARNLPAMFGSPFSVATLLLLFIVIS